MAQSKVKSRKKGIKNADIGIPDEFTVHPHLQQYFGYCLFKAAVRMRILFGELLKPYDLWPPQYGILGVLKYSGGQSQVEVGSCIGIDKATMVKLIDRLEAKKLIQRKQHPTDRRLNLLEITPKGIKLFEELKEVQDKCEAKFFAPLTKEEQRVLKQAFPKLLK